MVRFGRDQGGRAVQDRVPGPVRRALRRLVAVVHDLTGEGAYLLYCEHHKRTHPGQPVLSERDFWRERYLEQGHDPGSRCC
ncbi:YbdD/YjiX family protein [Lysinibacter sp. HNR]|uniref:YbdD/YjiX family protein n=1 Tax=Lysinibacter sp. HNR TaxID=3031408 RepID=UPI0024356F0C|nr:YbdD/YjiX family protein [Lysinibacter sp. HNR]WGD37020.1 YbdD/YjiX family protein [Lysinibacter sp. HNR]